VTFPQVAPIIGNKKPVPSTPDSYPDNFTYLDERWKG